MSVEKKASQLASLYMRKIADESAAAPGEQVLPADVVPPEVKSWWEKNVVNEPRLNNPSLKWGLGLGAGAGLLSYLTADDDEGERKDRDLVRRLLLGALGGGAAGMLWNQFSDANPEAGGGTGGGAGGKKHEDKTTDNLGWEGAQGGTRKAFGGIQAIAGNATHMLGEAYAGAVNNPYTVFPATVGTTLLKPVDRLQRLFQRVFQPGSVKKTITPYTDATDRLAEAMPVVVPSNERQRKYDAFVRDTFDALVARAVNPEKMTAENRKALATVARAMATLQVRRGRPGDLENPAKDKFTPRPRKDVSEKVKNILDAARIDNKVKIKPREVFDTMLPSLAARPNETVSKDIIDGIRAFAGRGSKPSSEDVRFLAGLPEDLRVLARNYAGSVKEHGSGKIRIGKRELEYPKTRFAKTKFLINWVGVPAVVASVMPEFIQDNMIRNWVSRGATARQTFRQQAFGGSP